MKTSDLIGAVFRHSYIDYYLGRKGQSERTLPFTPKDRSAIEWNLMFVAIACTFHTQEEYFPIVKEQLSKEMWTDYFQRTVRIGDYVNSKIELDAVSPILGVRGLFGSAANKNLTLRAISAVTANLKINAILGYFEGMGRENFITLTPHEFSTPPLIASFILLSYWGRQPDLDGDDPYLDALSTIVEAQIDHIQSL